MISDYLKKYSTYYLSRYSVTKGKFEDILKKKITKDYLEKKISKDDYNIFNLEIKNVINYFSKIGVFNEKRLLELTFQNYVKKGYSKKKIKYKILNSKFNDSLIADFFRDELTNENLDELLIKNYLNRTRIIEKQKKLNISDKQLFDKMLIKLTNQGFNYENSRKILKKFIL